MLGRTADSLTSRGSATANGKGDVQQNSPYNSRTAKAGSGSTLAALLQARLMCNNYMHFYDGLQQELR